MTKTKIYYKHYVPRGYWIVKSPHLARAQRFRSFEAARDFARDLMESLTFKFSGC
jgi:hypothetical protein